MKNILTIAVILTLFCRCSNSVSKKVATKIDPSVQYFETQKPSLSPVLFVPGIISKPDRHEFGCTLSEDNQEFYFGVDNNGKMEIYFTKIENGDWSPQEKLFNSDGFNYNDPMFSYDEKRLYFISNRPFDVTGKAKDVDIWYVEKLHDGWSDPINAGSKINSDRNEYYTSFTKNGTLYFSSKDKAEDAPKYAFDIYRSELENGEYQTPQKLPKEINTNRYEADVFIAPDESYMIFCSIRRDGLGSGDLYISFRDDDGNWTEAVNMGETINSEHHELCPFVTKDGRYLFYTSNKDIYWISTVILDKYRNE